MATTHRLPAVLAGALLAACAASPHVDPDALHRDLQQRAALHAPQPLADAGGETDAAVRDLLREPLDDDAAVRIALLHNRRLRAVYARLGVATKDLAQAGLLRNPVLGGDARFLFDGGAEIEMGLAQPFVDLLYRSLRVRVAEREYETARALLVDELLTAVFAVRRGAAVLRAAHALAALQRQELEVAVAEHELARALHDAGNVADRELAQHRLAETRARADLAAAELAVREAQEPLQRALGLWGEDTRWSLAGALPDDPLADVDLQKVEARAIASSLALAAFRSRADALANLAGLRRWEGWLPDGALGVSVLREPGGEWGLGPRFSFALPLFDDRSTAQQKAELQLQQALLEAEQLAVEVRSAARLLRDRASRLAERAAFLRDQHLPQRERVVRAVAQHYNAMQIGAFDVLDARKAQLADEREHVLVRRDALLARLDLERLLAGGLPPSAFVPTAQPAIDAAPDLTVRMPARNAP